MNQIDFLTASEKFNVFKYLRYLKLVVAIILFVATGITEGQLFLYIKIAVFIISIYSIYELIMRNIIFSVSNKIDEITKNTVYIILFSFIAIIFNPIIPIYFADTSIWHTIDILSLIIFLVSYGMDGLVFKDFKDEYLASIIQYELKKSNDLSVNMLSWIAESIEDNIDDHLKLRVAKNLYSKIIEIAPNNINAYHKRAIIIVKLNSVGAARLCGEGLGNAIFDLLKLKELGCEDYYSKAYSVLEMYLNLNSGEKRGYSKRNIADDKKILDEVMDLLFQNMKYWVPEAVRDNISKIENKLNYKDEL